MASEEPAMQISQLYLYPIKSLRGVPVKHAVIMKNGFLYDRCYMILKRETGPDGITTHKNMQIGYVPEMALFSTALTLPEGGFNGEIKVTYRAPDAGTESDLTIPLQPDLQGLGRVEVDLYHSKVSAYDMGPSYNEWFSTRFGYPVTLAAIGENLRPVLFPEYAAASTKATAAATNGSSSSWLSSITNLLPAGLTSSGAGKENENQQLKFQDVAPFLIASEESLKQVSTRLVEGQEADMRKFRPNIVVSSASPDAPIPAWDEDFWASLSITPSSTESTGEPITIPLKHNCLRCQSLNVDFATGKYSSEGEKQLLRKLQSDRRVDGVKRTSPVFGRYGFTCEGDLGRSVSVGDPVRVAGRNGERTGWDWPK